MTRFNITYYFLFVLLIMGGFASMAQNSYGTTILGVVAALFGLTFAVSLIAEWRKTNNETWVLNGLELVALLILSVLLSMRVFYVRFPLAKVTYGAAGVLLIVVFTLKAIQYFRSSQSENKRRASWVLLFHGSIALYILTMIAVPFIPQWSQPIGVVAFALLVGFLLSSFVDRKNNHESPVRWVVKHDGRSVVLGVLFVLFSAYMGLTGVGALPRLYSDEFPQAYYELVDQAETGKELPVDGRYQYELFKERYDAFVARHSGQPRTH